VNKEVKKLNSDLLLLSVKKKNRVTLINRTNNSNRTKEHRQERINEEWETERGTSIVTAFSFFVACERRTTHALSTASS
jgi:ribonucleotide monophosphatase NagD (HAD superfamily)